MAARRLARLRQTCWLGDEIDEPSVARQSVHQVVDEKSRVLTTVDSDH
jgi:hypothetical protein